MHSLPTISIITAVYNGVQQLEEAIKSVLDQTYPNIEYIIIDGGSTDGTVELIKKYQSNLHYWVSEKDKGVYDAWNKGVAAATGEWIAFLGADDFFREPNSLEKIIPYLEIAQRDNIRYLYGKVDLLNMTGNNILTTWGMPWPEAKKDIFTYMTVTHCGALHHRSLFADYGYFNTEFRITGDYDFTLREFSRGRDALFMDEIITAMHAGGISADLRLKLTVARENIRALRDNNLPVTFHHQVQIYKAILAGLLANVLGMNTVRKLSDLYRRLKGKDPIWTKLDESA